MKLSLLSKVNHVAYFGFFLFVITLQHSSTSDE